MLDQFNIKTAIGAVLINAVEQNFTGTQLLTGLYQLDGVDVSSFTAAFYGALIPAEKVAIKSCSKITLMGNRANLRNQFSKKVHELSGNFSLTVGNRLMSVCGRKSEAM